MSLPDFDQRVDSWQPDLPDYRDYAPEDDIIQQLLRPLEPTRVSRGTGRVDLREYFPKVSDQRGLSASPAHACIGLVDYFQRRAHGKLTKGSARFVYKTTRKLMRRAGNVGTDLRTTLKAMARFGVPPVEYCPYDVDRYDEEPDPFLYSFAKDTAGVVYFRLDTRNQQGSETLHRVRAYLAAGIPCVFGFSVPNSTTCDADLPWRPGDDSVLGGQAVVAAGYDDNRVRSTKGALLIRGSWGPGWGEDGYGWLPYRFVEEQLATVFWAVLSESWLASREFTRPQLSAGLPARRRKKKLGSGAR